MHLNSIWTIFLCHYVTGLSTLCYWYDTLCAIDCQIQVTEQGLDLPREVILLGLVTIFISVVHIYPRRFRFLWLLSKSTQFWNDNIGLTLRIYEYCTCKYCTQPSLIYSASASPSIHSPSRVNASTRTFSPPREPRIRSSKGTGVNVAFTRNVFVHELLFLF